MTSELAVRVTVIEPPRGLAALRNAFTPLLIALAILVIGMAVGVSLSSRVRAQARGEAVAIGAPGRRTPLRRAGIQPRPTPEQAEAYLLPITPSGGPIDPYPLSGSEVILGRDASLCTLALDDPSLSGMHARLIRLADGGYLVRDLGSLGGTRVNFRPVSAEGTRLTHGDRIDLGRSSFRIHWSNPPPPRRVEMRPLAPPSLSIPSPPRPSRPARRPRTAPEEPSRDSNG